MAYDRAPSFWFSLNTSYDHGHYEVVLPLVTLPSHHLVVPAGCRVASCHPLIVPPSCQLAAPACCCIASPHPLIALPSRRLVPPAGCRFASRRPSLCHRLDHCRWRTSQNWINIEVSRNKLISTLNYGIY